MKRGSIETYRLISKLSKRDILRLSRMTCSHSHSLLSHPFCALKQGILIETTTETGKKVYRLKEKIGFLDIETFTFNFNADQGIVLCYCIKELDKKVKCNWIKSQELKKKDKRDYRLLKDFVKDIETYTRLIGHNIIGFDLPLTRSRAVKYGLDFPIYKTIYISDTLKIMWNKFKLKSSSLRNACEFFGIPAKDTPFEFETWLSAAQGDKKAIKKVVKHCEEDVIATELLWKKINPFALESKRSI